MQIWFALLTCVLLSVCYLFLVFIETFEPLIPKEEKTQMVTIVNLNFMPLTFFVKLFFLGNNFFNRNWQQIFLFNLRWKMLMALIVVWVAFLALQIIKVSIFRISYHLHRKARVYFWLSRFKYIHFYFQN